MAEERSLETLKQILKDKYKTNDKIERLFYPDNPLPLAGCYLDLALVKEKVIKAEKAEVSVAEPTASSSTTSKNVQEDLSSREYFLHEYECIENIQKKLEVKAILAECKYPKKRIYIEGASGAGKSTLSRYIANEWANDQAPWNQYEWVFYIRLRELSIENYPAQLEELLKIVSGELFQGHGNHLNANELNSLFLALKKQPQKVLWVLDGYDELTLVISNCIWWKDLLHSHYDILMTSRPGTQLSKSELGINLNLAVLGFSDEQVEKYIRNFFNPIHTSDVEIQDANQCLILLKNNPNLWSLSHTPIQLELLCSSWRELSKSKELSLTELYRVMLEKLLKRRACAEGLVLEELNHKQLKARYADYLTYLEYLAFLGMQTKRIVLTEQEMNAAYNILSSEKYKQVDFFKQLKALGIIKRYNNGQQAEFAHLTFQEFFAARYVASAIKAFGENKPHSLSNQDLLDFVSKTKWDNFYEVMWWFVAGLLGGRPQADNQRLAHYKFHQGDSNTSQELEIPKSHQRLQTLQTLFDLLLQEPREPLEAFELPLLVSCLAEAGMPNIIQKEAIKQHFERWLEFYWVKGNYVLKTSALKKLVQVLQSRRELVVWIQLMLLKLLQDEDRSVRHSAVEAVSRLGVASEVLQAVLLQLFQNASKAVRCSAAEVVGRVGGSVSKTLQIGLLSLLQDANEDVRYSAAEAIGRIGGVWVKEALQTNLLSLFQNTNADVRRSVAEMVGRLGRSANKPLQKSLSALLYDEDMFVRRSAREAINRISALKNETLETNVLLFSQYEKVSVHRSETKAVIDRIDVSANKILQEDLSQLLQDKNSNVRCLTAKAVGSLGVAANEKLQKGLLALLQDVNKDVRCSAAEAVGRIGRTSSEALQMALLPLLHDKYWSVRQAAVVAVGRLGTSANDALQTNLLLLLKDKKWIVCNEAANVVLSLIASGRKELEKGLLLLLQNKDEYMREKAQRALVATKPGLALLCQAIDQDPPLSIPPSRLIVSPTDVIKVDKHGQLDCLRLCGSVLQNIIHNEFSHHLTENEWTLAIVRKKVETNNPHQATSSNTFFKTLKNIQSHAFLILEGVKASVRFATKIDLYAIGKKNSQSSGQKVAIQITEIDNFARLEELATNSCSMVHGISREQAEQLLEAIRQDQASAERGEIVYSLTGDGSFSSTSTVQKHSCISWCLEKWQQIGLPLKRKWYDTVVVIPSVYLEEVKQPEDKCLIM